MRIRDGISYSCSSDLTEVCGHAARLFCKYHGWSWKLDGTIAKVVVRHEWPAESLTDDDLDLVPVKLGRWSGWVYINLDPDSISLEEHLAPAKAYPDPYDIGGMNYHWRKSTIFDCNWKVRSEEHTYELHSLTRIWYAVLC